MATITKNPYADIAWGTVERLPANLHCHTLMSDGRAMPDTVIEEYAAAGYRVLAITDHDSYHTHREGEPEIEPTCEPTWPWTRWIDATPGQTWETDGVETAAYYPDVGEGLLAICGNEIKPSPELVTLFCDCGYDDATEAEADRLEYVAGLDGLSFWAHPMDYLPGGRWADHFDDSFDAGVEFYTEQLTTYPHNRGVELQAKNVDMALRLFDALVASLYHDQNVFLYANDDSHGPAVGEQAMCTIVFADEPTGPAVKTALECGHTLVGERSDPLPDIRHISTDEEQHTITVAAQHVDEIRWIQDGDVVDTGANFAYAGADRGAIRFELETNGSTLYSQPFLIE